MNSRRSKSIGVTPARGTFTTGAAGPDKVPLGGKIHKGNLREKPGKNQGKMPKTI